GPGASHHHLPAAPLRHRDRAAAGHVRARLQRSRRQQVTQATTELSPDATTVAPGASACLLREVSHSFNTSVVLHPIDLDLGRGSLLVVRGSNGSGKSTLLRIIAGLLRPTTGGRSAEGTSLLLASGEGARRRDRVER